MSHWHDRLAVIERARAEPASERDAIDLVQLEQLVYAWRITADELAGPARREVLIGTAERGAP